MKILNNRFYDVKCLVGSTIKKEEKKSVSTKNIHDPNSEYIIIIGYKRNCFFRVVEVFFLQYIADFI